MADRTVRVGRVSSIDYDTGMISVTYPDLDGATTVHLAMLTFGDEYKMPGIGDNVLVLHLSSDQSRGVVLGTYWDKGHSSRETGADVYLKEFSHAPGEAYISYSESTRTLKISAPSISINGQIF